MTSAKTQTISKQNPHELEKYPKKSNQMYISEYFLHYFLKRPLKEITSIFFCSYRNWYLFCGIVLLALATRFYKVTEPDHVW